MMDNGQYQLAIMGEREMSSMDNLIPRDYTVREAFGFASEMVIQGYEPGHPLVPKIAKGYIWNAKLVKDAIAWLQEEDPDPVWATGPTGCGKTEFFKNLFGVLNIPLVVISAKSSTEPDDILGRTQLRNGNTEFVPGELIRAYTKGYGLLFDEIDGYPPEVGMACHRMFERAVITLDDGSIHIPAKRNLICATANTRGDGQGNDVYSATQIFNLATLNRFEKWKVEYPSQAEEISILKAAFQANLKDNIIEAMVKTAGDIRTAYSQGSCPGPISIRDMLRWGKKLIGNWSRKDVEPVYHSFNLAFGYGVDDHVLAMLHTLIQTHFGVRAPSSGLTP